MENINVKIIHPTNNSVIDIGLPGSIILRDVYSQLIDEGLLNEGVAYGAALKPSGARTEKVQLDNNKTIEENGISNNDTIQLNNSTPAGI